MAKFRLTSRPTNGYGKQKRGLTKNVFGRLARVTSENPGNSGTDIGVRVRGRRK